MQTVDVRRAVAPLRKAHPTRRPTPIWWKFGAGSVGAGVFGAEGAMGYLHPAFGEALAAADAIGPLIVALVLLTAILCGNNETCERVFRLLRWITNRPEPPANDCSDRTPGTRSGRRGTSGDGRRGRVRPPRSPRSG
jgi:hypothetical protein